MVYDFLFIYEVKNRELENICLLKNELEKRGYTVKLYETWYRWLHYVDKVEAKVVITFALYGDGMVSAMNVYAKNIKKLVNLQWEQIFTIVEEDKLKKNGKDMGSAKNAVHISWGKYNHDALINYSKLNAENAPICGQVSLDFYKPLLNGYYLSREEICDKFHLDSKKRLHMFISTLCWCELPDSVLNQDIYQNLAFDPFVFRDVSIKSQKAILDWYERIAIKHPEIEFIYRPHPAEINSKILMDLEKRVSNFHVIGDLSVKQWILIVDDMATWYSTSIAEVYAAKKNCIVLRPVEIPRDMDMRIYLGCDSISEYSQFEKCIENNENKNFPISDELIKRYYDFDDEYSYVKICNVLENVLKDDKFKYNFKPVNIDKVTNKSLKMTVRKYIPLFVFDLKERISIFNQRFTLSLINKGIIKKRNDKIEDIIFADKMIKKNFSSEKEIEYICNKLKRVIRENSK